MLNVLVIEDDSTFQRIYEELLAQQGLNARIVSSVQDARAALRGDEFDAVILDQRLQGEGGPDDGIPLIEDAQRHGAKVFLVTGFASTEMIRRAYEFGVFDYLEKGPHLRTLLSAKLDQVRELVRARSRNLPAAEKRMRELWSSVGDGTPQARGKRLEDLVLLIMTSVPGFQEGWKHLRTPAEELDVAIRNESTDPFWSKQPSYILAECNNWSKAVGTAEIGWFADRVRERPDARLGFFFAPNGFSEPVDEKVRSYRKEGIQLVVVDRVDIDRLVHSDDRSRDLKALHARWAVGH
jgi:ActR/RegA family two-component response regulator